MKVLLLILLLSCNVYEVQGEFITVRLVKIQQSGERFWLTWRCQDVDVLVEVKDTSGYKVGMVRNVLLPK